MISAEFAGLLTPEAGCGVGRNRSAVGYNRAVRGRGIRAQSRPIKDVGVKPGAATAFLPKVAGAERAGQRLVVVEIDPMICDVSQVGRTKEELRRTPVLALRHRMGEIGVGGEAAGGVRGGQFLAIDFAAAIVECRENEGLAE